ncbi:IclR family transcriptional regulator [Sphingomonas sp. AR_OL41]|jgi:DNA-binding IclR family transcriptional regulator|uniref:IclR family transcriptional regulator n=1 Tax=Sphingomonas sp. AR_OL41 TaxID=3042729 RepID=UPI0024814DF8|nr:IclR family transcriptional regulator [Sphingomonas sp. AR_OL41]MDH7973639.1 IclR family transcriptional regulator [Sphingomonas sp. AR_OL41]
MNSKAGVAAVDRAFDILHAFTRDRPVLSLAEIARITGLYKSTILRLMGSLEKYGFVWQRKDGNYQLGAGLLSLSAVFQDAFDLRQFVEPVLEEMVALTSEGASFFIRDGDDQVCLFRVEGRHMVRDHSISQGDRRPLNASAASTILRHYGDAMPAPLRPEDACVISIGTVNPEMAAIGVPVFETGHRISGAITLSGPAARFTPEYVERMRGIAVAGAARLSISLGDTLENFALVRAPS